MVTLKSPLIDLVKVKSPLNKIITNDKRAHNVDKQAEQQVGSHYSSHHFRVNRPKHACLSI